MSKKSLFYTREAANKGTKVPLFTPDGKATEEWLLVLGVDSDEFRRAETRSRRAALEIAQIEDKAERDEVADRYRLELIASLIVSWSFDEECTLEEKVEFLREAPQVADLVDQIALNRKAFFGEGSSSSTSSQKQSSGSKGARKGRK